MFSVSQSPMRAVRLFLGLFLLSSLAITLSAQVVSPCIVTCVQPIADQNGCMFQNTTCVCGNAKIQSEIAACLQEKCTGEEQKEALQLQKRQCGPLAITPTTTPPIPTGTSTSVITPSSPAPLPTTFLTTFKPATAGGSSTSAAPGSTQTNSTQTNPTPAPISTPPGSGATGTGTGVSTPYSPASQPTTLATTSKPATSGGSSTSAATGSTQTNLALTNLPMLHLVGGIASILSAWNLAGLLA